MNAKNSKKPSVLVIADFPNWAYYEIQQFIKAYLSNDFDIYSDYLIFNSKKKSKNPFSRFKMAMEKLKYQETKHDNKYDIVVYLGFYFEDMMKVNFTSNFVIKGIYTDGFPPANSNFQGDPNDFVTRFLSSTDAIVCGSPLIKSYYKRFYHRSYFANLALDKDMFRRLEKKKLNNSSRFIVGWTGNPKREFKGFYTHIEPAVKLAKRKYPSIELKVRFSGPIETLPNFYYDVDVVVIASDKDAGPALFGEACLMDVPSISTDIGWPHEVIKPGVNGFIVERSIEAISEKIIELYENRQELFTISKRIREDYLNVFSSDIMAENWKLLFKELINTNNRD